MRLGILSFAMVASLAACGGSSKPMAAAPTTERSIAPEAPVDSDGDGVPDDETVPAAPTTATPPRPRTRPRPPELADRPARGSAALCPGN